MTEEFSEFLNFFLDEALDALNVWEKSCLELERTASLEAKEDLYRSAHNLKSGSGAVGLTAFNETVHKVEDLISKVLSGQLEAKAPIIKIFLNAHSLLCAWIEKLKVRETFDHSPAASEILLSIRLVLETPDDLPSEEVRLEALSPAALLLQSVQAPGSAGAELPPSLPAPAAQPEAAPEALAAPSEAPSESRSNQSPFRSQESIRVAAAKLDQLIQLIGELSTQQAIVWHARQNELLQSQSSDNAIQLIQKISKDLQGLALSLRLQPLQSLFQRLERTGRDLARSQNKRIDVALSGEHVEVDRTVIERIADAMNHVIRNAVDHGVEIPAAREAAGKSPSALLKIEAVQETKGVSITVKDDGRGLDTARIQKKAIERGIIRPDANLPATDIHRLIFHAGLSTAEKVTDISGRGVGMDVVKNSVETIGGSIHVSSQPNEGTSFAITLPATLSIIDALIVSVDGCRYAVPVQDVAEIIDAQHSKIDAVSGYGRLLSLRDQLIPVECLRDHLPPRREPAARALNLPIQPGLIVRSGLDSLVFEVDFIQGQQPVTVRRLPNLIANIEGYIGGTILGDGDPCVILNLPALVFRHFSKSQRAPSSESQIESPEGSENWNAIENRYLIFETRGCSFGAPLLKIKEIVCDQVCEPMTGSAPHVIGTINLRGHLLPVYDFGTILGLPSASGEEATDIVLEDGDDSYALRVHHIRAVTDLRGLKSPIGEHREAIVPGLHGYLGTGLHEGKSIPMINLQDTVRHLREVS